ncbi:MAG: putative manganese transporter [Oscillospiraceae bacterium]
MTNVILEAIIDSLKSLPFLFLAYFLIEYLEHKSNDKFKTALAKNQRFGSIPGAILGTVPQCGFSVMAANLYAGGVITVGTLLAVFISTSDEAIPILVSNPAGIPVLLKIIVLKILVAVAVGLVIDSFAKKRTLEEGTQEICHDCGCGHERSLLKATLYHTVKTFAFIMIINLALNLLIYFIGEQTITKLLLTDSVFQPLIAAAIGFIPNCAASVLLTDLYLEGVLSFGSLAAGLCSGAGLGLAVLFKANKNIKDSFKIAAILYVVAVVVGVILQILNCF